MWKEVSEIIDVVFNNANKLLLLVMLLVYSSELNSILLVFKVFIAYKLKILLAYSDSEDKEEVKLLLLIWFMLYEDSFINLR